jgi:hypothetical protein
MIATRPNSKPCQHCGSEFTPVRPLQRVCSPICARRKVMADKKAAAATIKARKEALKRIPDYIKEAQHAFNAFIRARDAGKPCICCGRTEAMGYGLAAHGWDCGHYRSTGSASHLRFNEDNAHRQLVVCNRHGAGRAVDYRIGLINRIGLDRVEALECNNTPHKWQREELIEVTQVYRKKLKELQG